MHRSVRRRCQTSGTEQKCDPSHSEHHRNTPYLFIPEGSPVVKPNIIELARRTAFRLAELVRSDGKFIYKYDPTSMKMIHGYNVLRHSGCIWALNVSEQAGLAGPRRTSRLAMNWLIANRLLPRQESGLCVVSKGSIKLGGNALAILALNSFSDFSKSDEELVRALCLYIWSQLNSDGSFVHKRDEKTNEILPFRSFYYDGEAIFALLSAAQRFSDQEQTNRVRDVLLTHVRQGCRLDQPNHWMMYAIETCQKLAPPHRALTGYANTLATHLVEDTSYRSSTHSTMIACRSEALLSYLRISLANSEPDKAKLKAVWQTINENLRIQLDAMLPDGGFRQYAHRGPVRIDYLQHNLTTLIGYARLERAMAAI
jgi:hypothetical protein